MNELGRIIARTREEVGRRRAAIPAARLERDAAKLSRPAGVRPFSDALKRPGLSLIAEHKRRSPSAGVIRDGLVLEQVVAAYERGGAAALSILTDGPSFGGSLEDLRAARASSGLPILRKDFIVDRYQIDESLVAGADAILLIVAALRPAELRSLHAQALAIGLDALVEVHDERDLELALGAGAELIGINNRDLKTLTVNPAVTFQLLPQIPPGTTVVAESGFSASDQLDELERAGVDGVLIGEALMGSGDIETACRTLTRGGPEVPPEQAFRST